MNEINYQQIITDLEFHNAWKPLRIKLEITSDQYTALLKGYEPHWDMRYGIIYSQSNDYFYAYRSGFVVGKYKLEKQADGDYSFSEMYENRPLNDCMVIFDCIIETCKQNRVHCDGRTMLKWRNETIAINESNNRERLPDLGPQSPSENSFTAKARKLQSLWRIENNLEIGVGPNKNSVDRNTGLPTFYGNMIKEGEITGRNFYFPETFEYAKWRVKTKLKDETIDEYRLFNNLMSSMPMAFNLFHPLIMLKTNNPAMIDDAIRVVFPEIKNIHKVLEIGLEFIPTPIEYYTGDKSAMDAFIKFQDKSGSNYLIAIETKYTDSLGTNTTSNKSIYQRQLEIIKNLNVFTPNAVEAFESGKLAISQIYRNFLLAEVYGLKQGYKEVYSVILSPKDHPTTDHELKILRDNLKEEFRHKVFAITLEDFIEKIQFNVNQQVNSSLYWFKERYLNFAKIEAIRQ